MSRKKYHALINCQDCEQDFIPCYVFYKYKDSDIFGKVLVCNNRDMMYWVEKIKKSYNMEFLAIAKGGDR